MPLLPRCNVSRKHFLNTMKTYSVILTRKQHALLRDIIEYYISHYQTDDAVKEIHAKIVISAPEDDLEEVQANSLPE